MGDNLYLSILIMIVILISTHYSVKFAKQRKSKIMYIMYAILVFIWLFVAGEHQNAVLWFTTGMIWSDTIVTLIDVYMSVMFAAPKKERL